MTLPAGSATFNPLSPTNPIVYPRKFFNSMLRSSQPQRFVAGMDRGQSALLPECLDDWVDESNPVRVVDAFVNALDLAGLGFEGMEPTVTGRPSYHPSVLLKLYIYGYINQVQSSRRLEREAGRNLEVMWLLGLLFPMTR